MRKPAALFLLIGFLFINHSYGQSSELLVQGETGKLYLLHTVAPKENWYSVGRLFNLSPKEIAPFNHLTMDKPLDIGESLQIPLTSANFSQSGPKAAAGETLVPVYHIVQEKEWMYRISVNHNKVPVENLEKWNSISKDNVKAGMHLVIGYLKVKTALSALASGGASPVAVVRNAADSQAKARQVVASTGVSAGTSTGTGVVSGPAKSKPANMHADSVSGGRVGGGTGSNTGVGSASGDTGSTTGSTGTTTGAGSGNKSPGATGTAGTGSGGTGSAGTGTGGTGPGTAGGGAAHFNGGYFKTDYNDENLSASGVAGVFKSTSGWQDGKYYALMNNVAVGTIIRVTASANNKTIYAKVLGQLPDMKESAGMTIRISNAAASELAQTDPKFNVDVRY
ncbi:MAG: LysM peptidoglycan-binding domain-containing protein [Puia sp.]|nr:LysM peptidoglycan-binding domain-containing protein [Puia sp.]